MAVRARGLFSDSAAYVPPTVPFRYTVVAGDTPASVASVFATDPSVIAASAGSTDGTLAPGVQITVNAAPLWKRMTGDPFASNEALVQDEARQRGVHPSLALAVAWQESRLQQEARSSTGAMGIMQVEPDTATLASQDLGISLDPGVARDNVIVGLFWLHSLLTSYGGNEASTLAAYYEGPGNLERRGYLSGTAAYVSRVQQTRRALLTVNPHLDS